MICSECCTIVSEGKFCPNCGAPLKPDGFAEQEFPVLDFENPLLDNDGSSYTAGAVENPYTASASSTAGAPYATGAAGAPYTADTPYATNDPYAASSSNAPYTAGTPYNTGDPYVTDAPYTTTRTAAGYAPYTDGQKAPAAALVLVIVGLVLSLTGILTMPGLVCSVIGLALNSSYKRKGLFNQRKTATFVIGLIGLIMGILISIVLTGGLMLAVDATENGDVDLETYLEEILNGDADLSDEDEIPSIVHVEGRDADDDMDDIDEDDATADSTHGGIAGRISDDDDADGGAANGAADAGLIEAQEAFAGEWTLVGFANGGEDRADLMDLMDSMGVKATLVLRANGEAELSIFGQENYNGTWEANSPTNATLTFENDSALVTIDDGVLTLLASDDDALYFEKE